jgi:hypothetical protein
MRRVVPFAGRVLVLAGAIAAGEWWRRPAPAPPPTMMAPMMMGRRGEFPPPAVPSPAAMDPLEPTLVQLRMISALSAPWDGPFAVEFIPSGGSIPGLRVVPCDAPRPPPDPGLGVTGMMRGRSGDFLPSGPFRPRHEEEPPRARWDRPGCW